MGAVISEQNASLNDELFIINSSLDVLTQIYSEDKNLVIYEREAPVEAIRYVQRLLKVAPDYSFTQVVDLNHVKQKLETSLPDDECRGAFVDDLYTICDMFVVLFGLEKIGLRLSVLERAMCPRFHVDNVPCRLLTTYGDTGTEWLSESNLDRSQLGRGSKGMPDEISGIYSDENQINRVNSYDIALLKGEAWPKNAGKGAVHRSPVVDNTNPRLLLSLDFV